jgi:acetolactate synthase-1/2/3 large subunit
VFNDNAYGNVLRTQIEDFDGRVIGTRLHNPDFQQLGRSFGIHTERAGSTAALTAALRDAATADAPVLIEVPVGMFRDPAPLSRELGGRR